jgi:hypothetical protein
VATLHDGGQLETVDIKPVVDIAWSVGITRYEAV